MSKSSDPALIEAVLDLFLSKPGPWTINKVALACKIGYYTSQRIIFDLHERNVIRRDHINQYWLGGVDRTSTVDDVIEQKLAHLYIEPDRHTSIRHDTHPRAQKLSIDDSSQYLGPDTEPKETKKADLVRSILIEDIPSQYQRSVLSAAEKAVDFFTEQNFSRTEIGYFLGLTKGGTYDKMKPGQKFQDFLR